MMRSDSSKNSIIGVDKIRHFITKPINRDGNSIGYDNSPLKLLNKSPHACITIK